MGYILEEKLRQEVARLQQRVAELETKLIWCVERDLAYSEGGRILLDWEGNAPDSEDFKIPEGE